MTGPRYPIPSTLNVVLTSAQVVGSVLLLRVASNASSPFVFWSSVLAFAFWMQMGFSILHEAEHNKLHSSRVVNDFLGTMVAVLFPGSYQLLKTAHLSHHKKNRSDAELVDYVRPGESRLAKRVQFYALVCGLVWIGVPLFTVVVSLVPWGLVPMAESGAKKSGVGLYLAFIREIGAWRVRGEALLTVAVWWALFRVLRLDVAAVAIAYAAFAFSWSSQQYIYHVRSPRHLVEGAFNLKLWRPLELLYLQFNYHLTHHRAVSIPWIHLRRATAELPTQGYLATYWRLWRPPEPVSQAWPVDFQANGPLVSRQRHGASTPIAPVESNRPRMRDDEGRRAPGVARDSELKERTFAHRA